MKSKVKNILKRYWMALSLIAVVVCVSVGYIVYVSAESAFTLTVNLPLGNFTRPTDTIQAKIDSVSSAPPNYDIDNITWEASDVTGYPVFKFKDNLNTGRNAVSLLSNGAGKSYLAAHYYDEYYIDADGNIADVNTGTKEIADVTSNVLEIRVPLVMTAARSDGASLELNDVFTVGDAANVKVTYNGHVRTEELDGTFYYYDDQHPAVFSYNENVLSMTKTVDENGTSVTFAPIGGGSSTISATVDEDVTGNIEETIYVGVKFKKEGGVGSNDGNPVIVRQYVEGQQTEVYTLSEDNTNIKNDNFNADEYGKYNVYFWTYEEYLAAMKGKTDTVPVVDISDNGVVTGKYAGTTTIYASCKPMSESYNSDGSLNADYADFLIVKVPFDTYFGESVIVGVGDDIPVYTSALPDNTYYTLYNEEGAIQQSEDDPNVFKAVKAGTAKIVVTAGIYNNGVEEIVPEAILNVTVIDKITLSTTYDTVNVGATITATATPTCMDPTKGTYVQWVSSDPNIATVTFDPSSLESSLNVTITGVKKGTVTISALQTVNGVVKIATMTVTVTVPVDGISLSEPTDGKDYMTMYLNETRTIYANLEYLNNDVPDDTNLIWTVSGEQLITLTPTDTEGVTQACQVTATALGQTTITVYSVDSNQIVTCDVFITEKPTSITLSDYNVVSYMSLKEYQMKAKVNSPNNGAEQTVTWGSLDEDVVRINKETGLVTFVQPGATYIYATSTVDPSIREYCYFEIAQDVTGVKIDQKDLTLNVGDTYRITATVSPVNAYDKSVKWTSSNPNVVKVENTSIYENNIKAVGSGSATIFVETKDGGFIAFVNVRVLQPATSIEISQTEMTVKRGTEFYLNATVKPDTADDKTIVWSSDDEKIATVSKDGKVIALELGQCTITATNPKSGVSAFCVVTVTESVSGLSLNSYYETLNIGDKFVIIPEVTPKEAADKGVTFWSSDTSVATVDNKGVVTAVKAGNCEIIVTTDELQLTAKCVIKVIKKAQKMDIPDEVLVNKGGKKKIDVTFTPADTTITGLIWSTADPNIATVDEHGIVTGINYGKVEISARTADGSNLYDVCTVQVIKPVESITLDKSKVTMYVGDVINIKATVNPDDATIKELNWKPLDEGIIKVYDNGDVEALSPGRTKVIVTSTDGNNIQAECIIIVKQTVSATSVTINSDEITMLVNKTRKLTARMYPLNATESVKWLSTDTSIVVVDNEGQITTVGPGTCEIIAYTTYGTVEDRCIVHSVGLSEGEIEIEQYDTFPLYVDGSTDDISWRSSNPRIASVTQNGVVTARMPGECTITATIDNKTITCTIKVVSIDPNKFINRIESDEMID